MTTPKMTTPNPQVQPNVIPLPNPQMQAGMAAVSVTARIADFWTDQPRAWFVHAESTITPQNMSDEAKYNTVLSKLAKDTITQTTDLIMSPPVTGKYQALKDKLLALYEESENRQIQKLISGMELGDQKPSHLLQRMKELARDKVPDTTLSILWQGHLPASVRAVLTVVDSKDLNNLAAIADQVWENTRPMQVSEVTTTPKPSSSSLSSSVDTALILAEIAKLTVRVNEMERSRPRYRNDYRNFRRRSSSRHRTRSNSRPRRTPANADWLCRNHFRYGERATNCNDKPCAWKGREGN
ncbi:hypothetical protein O0L34_g19491 [Tuta absoluta]|nr:hypothetical protein O0L34_g19491 [Tuta absoluta]